MCFLLLLHVGYNLLFENYYLSLYSLHHRTTCSKNSNIEVGHFEPPFSYEHVFSSPEWLLQLYFAMGYEVN